MKTTTVLAFAAAAFVAGCTFDPAYNVTCTSEGAQENGRVCQSGVWVSQTRGELTDMGPIGADSPPTCVPETDSALCARLGLTCEMITVNDNCGMPRTANCGVCEGAASCGGGGTPNVCACSDQTDLDFCAAAQKTCDPYTATDVCGAQRTVNCGTCAGLESCAADNTCTCDVAAACVELDAECGMIDVTGMCAGTNEITCGSCGDNSTCSDSYKCDCDAGFEKDNNDCVDVDECDKGIDDCDANASCTNNPGGFSCMCDVGYVGDGKNCMLDADLVTAVRNVTVNMDGATQTQTFSAIDEANSVPFVSMLVRDSGHEGDRLAIDVEFTAADEVTISREDVTGAITAEISIVEFDPQLATVQSGSFSFNQTTHSETLAASVDPNKSFVVFYYKRTTNSGDRDNLFVTAKFGGGGTSLEFSRVGNAGNVDGHYWVVEGNGAFNVQHEETSMDNVAVNIPINTVSLSKSMVLYSNTTNHAGRRPRASNLSCSLSATTNVSCRRAAPEDDIPQLNVQVVTFTGDPAVQQGDESFMPGTEEKVLSITTVDATATAFGGSIGLPGVASHDTQTDQEIPGGSFTQTIISNGTELRLRRGTPREAPARTPWQVIDW